MADQRDSPDDLYPFAQMLVRKLIKKHGLRWDRRRVEDSEQELFLAGWTARPCDQLRIRRRPCRFGAV